MMEGGGMEEEEGCLCFRKIPDHCGNGSMVCWIEGMLCVAGTDLPVRAPAEMSSN